MLAELCCSSIAMPGGRGEVAVRLRAGSVQYFRKAAMRLRGTDRKRDLWVIVKIGGCIPTESRANEAGAPPTDQALLSRESQWLGPATTNGDTAWAGCGRWALCEDKRAPVDTAESSNICLLHRAIIVALGRPRPHEGVLVPSSRAGWDRGRRPPWTRCPCPPPPGRGWHGYLIVICSSWLPKKVKSDEGRASPATAS